MQLENHVSLPSLLDPKLPFIWVKATVAFADQEEDKLAYPALYDV